MDQIAAIPATVTLIAANVIASFYAFANPAFMEKNLFHVGPILSQREWHRMVTSGFLHGGGLHLLINMYVLWSFGGILEEQVLGAGKFLIVYFAALLGGNAWALLENRKLSSYRALGASGATAGIILSFTLFAPFQPLFIFPIPVPMPAVVLALVFVVASAVLAQRSNKVIGHEAHLGGALAGILATIAVEPRALTSFAQQVATALGGS